MPGDLPLLQDGDDRTRWACPPDAEQQLTVDTGQLQQIGGVLYNLGPYHWEYATQMALETSADGQSWVVVRSGSVLGDAIRAGLQHPQSLPIMLAFDPRPARFVRIRPVNQNKDFVWTIAEVEVWSGR